MISKIRARGNSFNEGFWVELLTPVQSLSPSTSQAVDEQTCFKTLCSLQVLPSMHTGDSQSTMVMVRAKPNPPMERVSLIGFSQSQCLLERQQFLSSSKGPSCTNSPPPTVHVNYSSVTWPLFLTLILSFPRMPQGV